MRSILYIGRVAPIKGLSNLCAAIGQLDMRDWRLRIVGPDQENHTAQLKDLSEELGIKGSIDFIGPKYGKELQLEYAGADVFVLPSYSENFGSVVVEALAHGVPVITTKGTPWKELEEYRCGWWIDVGVAPLATTLAEAMSLSGDERREMGMRGRRLVEEKYTWDAVATKMLKGYDDVIGGCQ